MKTKLGTEIPEGTKVIVYFCELSRDPLSIRVVGEQLHRIKWNAMIAYAHTPNPESQIIAGKTTEELTNKLDKLHRNMEDPAWLQKLADCI